MISEVNEITPELEAMTGDADSRLGTGGMQTKLHAARLALEGNIELVIANGSDPDILYDIVEGKAVGTWFKCKDI